jgi:hypothetical protein
MAIVKEIFSSKPKMNDQTADHSYKEDAGNGRRLCIVLTIAEATGSE